MHLEQVTNPAVRIQLEAFLAQADLHDLPESHLLVSETGSATVEWFLEHRRVAFTFDPDPKTSGWHVVSLGGLNALGNLPPGDRWPRVRHLLAAFR